MKLENKLNMNLNYEAHEFDCLINVNGGDLTKFVDDCLTAFDNALRNIISVDKFDVGYEDTDEGQKVVIDSIIESLK